jgi:hypothetical protein
VAYNSADRQCAARRLCDVWHMPTNDNYLGDAQRNLVDNFTPTLSEKSASGIEQQG